MMKINITFLALVIYTPALLWGQGQFDEVRLFQSFMRDATITTTAYDEAFIDYNHYPAGNLYALGIQGGFAVSTDLEINGRFGLGGYTPEGSDGEIGLADLILSARHLVHNQENVQVTLGGGVSLPVGEEKAGYSHFSLGGFGALRYLAGEQLLITGALGLDITEGYALSYKSTFSISVTSGFIYQYNSRLNFIGELIYRSNMDYGVLSVGVDYLLSTNRIRGAIGVGIDDQAPDVQLQIGYIFSF